LVRDQVKSAADVFALMDVLSLRSEIYAAINNDNHEYWIERPDCRRPVRELNLFRAKQMTPLVIVAWERLSAPEFAKLLKLLSVLTFRYSVIGRLNTNELESVYHQAARLLIDGAASTAGELFSVLRAVYVDDVAFEQNFARLDMDTTGQRKQLVKYILSELETDASGTSRAYETDPGTIEHILPENASQDWEHEFPADQWGKYVYRLGNLTLLEGPINRDIGDAPYPRKAARYAQSNYALTTAVVERAPDQWNPALLEARQAQMARRAVHIWRSGYA
ncbi:MAG TPA: HNH endonuclease family protein, partial [Ramlibacter sp.]|nr:HNH endonuclease family protein [Ramlibacter sp.]